MTSREAAESELKALLAETIGHLRLISESSTPITRTRARQLLLEAERSLRMAATLADQLT